MGSGTLNKYFGIILSLSLAVVTLSGCSSEPHPPSDEDDYPAIRWDVDGSKWYYDDEGKLVQRWLYENKAIQIAAKTSYWLKHTATQDAMFHIRRCRSYLEANGLHLTSKVPFFVEYLDDELDAYVLSRPTDGDGQSGSMYELLLVTEATVAPIGEIADPSIRFISNASSGEILFYTPTGAFLIASNSYQPLRSGRIAARISNNGAALKDGRFLLYQSMPVELGLTFSSGTGYKVAETPMGEHARQLSRDQDVVIYGNSTFKVIAIPSGG